MGEARRSFWRGARDMLPLLAAGVSFGFVAGAAIANAGLGLGESMGMSVGTYGASAQLAATLLWQAAAPLVVTTVTALVINSRFFVYSASFAPHLDSEPPLTRLLAAYLMRDGAYALAMTNAAEDIRIVPYYLGAASLDWLVWIVATAVGTLVGGLVPASWSLDFVVPLVFIALLANAVRGRIDAEVALTAALASAVLVPRLPFQLGIVASIAVGMAWGVARERFRPRGATA